MVSEFRVEVDRPLKDVYAAFNNPDNMPRWLEGLQRTEQISGRPGEVGSKMKQIYLERGRIVEMIETMTAHEPMKSMSGNLEAPGMTCAIHIEFVDKGASTVVVARTNMKAQSFLMTLMTPFIRGAVRKRQRGDLARFKSLIEADELAL